MQGLNIQRENASAPAPHGATAWKCWSSCPTDHLDFENLENRRRYHNPGKPRTAGLCGREVVASDHLPVSSTFFGRPKLPDLTHKTAAAVPPPIRFFLWRYPRNPPLPTSAHTGRTRPATASASPGCHPLRQSPTQPLTGDNVCPICPEPRFLPKCPAPFPERSGDSLPCLQ